MRIEETIALISINETLIIQLISFLLFLIIINRVMFRPLRSVMAQREEHIRHIQQEISIAKNDLDGMMARMREEEKVIRKEAREKQVQIEAEGQKEAETIFNSVREQILTQKENAQEQISAQIEKARLQIKAESEALAMSIIEKVLERRLG
ncbi:MAG: ATP synthase F0 subunit B [Proteobacteria bacterium]|nr:ATP synthase F0 subunit B [Pseudomonadota bacterium]MBU4469138.1 ATP synthase F0 subunit B [Pseudomonadota bacterium]MCG2752170.1 ATP synthase F0 subunit B [Desulfobacteraceae bacterium]